MSRLFITQREIDFISDLTKEVIKDLAGQKIYFYRVLGFLNAALGKKSFYRPKINN